MGVEFLALDSVDRRPTPIASWVRAQTVDRTRFYPLPKDLVEDHLPPPFAVVNSATSWRGAPAESDTAIRTRPDPASHVGVTLHDRHLLKGELHRSLLGRKPARRGRFQSSLLWQWRPSRYQPKRHASLAERSNAPESVQAPTQTLSGSESRPSTSSDPVDCQQSVRRGPQREGPLMGSDASEGQVVAARACTWRPAIPIGRDVRKTDNAVLATDVERKIHVHTADMCTHKQALPRGSRQLFVPISGMPRTTRNASLPQSAAAGRVK
jgi:hypothetical protein